MKYGVLAIALCVSLMGAWSFAAEGVPSRDKLNKLGLGSMRLASDQQGSQVRGRFFFSYTFTIQASAGSMTTMMTGGDTIGTPLSFDPPPVPLPISVTETAGPLTETMGNTTNTGFSTFTLTVGGAPSIVLPAASASFLPILSPIGP